MPELPPVYTSGYAHFSDELLASDQHDLSRQVGDICSMEFRRWRECL